MKIEMKNGMIVYLEAGEDISAVLPILQQVNDESEHREISTDILNLRPQPAPEPNKPSILSPAPRILSPEPRVPTETPNPKNSRSDRSSVFVTEDEARIIRLLRQHPEGMTSRQVADRIGLPLNVTSQIIWRLRTQRPARDTTTPLSVKITAGRHLLTPLGKNLKLLIAARPAYENRNIGWE